MFKKSLLLVTGLMIVFAIPASAETTKTVKMTTYYPAPYGEYKQVQFAPQATLPDSACNSNSEGVMYYDSNEYTTKLCVNDGAGAYKWVVMSYTIPPQWLGTGTYNSFHIPNGATDKQKLPLGSVDGNATSIETATAVQIDLSALPSGFYEVEWQYNVNVDAYPAGKGVYAYLQAKKPGGDWKTIDSVFLEDDSDVGLDGITPNEGCDNQYTHQSDTRALNVTYPKYAFMKYRILVDKNGTTPAVRAPNKKGVDVNVIAGQYIKVSRV